MSALATSLWITLIGMALVFAMIVLLWGLTALVTRLGARLSRAEAERNDPDLPNKRLAAAAAVAAALAAATALEQAQGALPEEMRVFPPPPTSTVSAWQAVMRSKTLNRKGPDR
jgi:Na+-transporting methylmalonyl-CoA/oxaloacetate decarboxylase gamma subunit